MTFTAVYQEVPEGYIGFVDELPGVNIQEPTLDKARESLAEAVALVLDANRHLAEEPFMEYRVNIDGTPIEKLLRELMASSVSGN